SRAPEVLVALKGADNGRTCREQAGRGRPRPSVMDDGGSTGEQPAMRRALDDQYVGVVAHAAQPSPPARDHGADAGLPHRVADRRAHPGGIWSDAAAEADIDRWRPGGHEPLEAGVGR